MSPRSQYRTIFTTYIKYFILIISSILSPNVWKKAWSSRETGRTDRAERVGGAAHLREGKWRGKGEGMHLLP